MQRLGVVMSRLIAVPLKHTDSGPDSLGPVRRSAGPAVESLSRGIGSQSSEFESSSREVVTR